MLPLCTKIQCTILVMLLFDRYFWIFMDATVFYRMKIHVLAPERLKVEEFSKWSGIGAGSLAHFTEWSINQYISFLFNVGIKDICSVDLVIDRFNGGACSLLHQISRGYPTIIPNLESTKVLRKQKNVLRLFA